MLDFFAEMSHRPSFTSPRRVVLALALLVPLALSCGSDTTAKPEDAAAVLAMLEEYLPRLALAYRNGSAEILEGYAAEKEIAGMNKRIRDLDRESRELSPTFKSVELEQVHIWGHANALATTLEVWDIEVYVAGTQNLLSSVENQSNRVRYQLLRVDDSWIVLFRELETTFE